MNAVKTGLLMAVLFGIFMGLGRLIGGMQGLVFGFVFALATNFFAYWFSDKIALSMNGAREVREQEAPQLFQLVGRLAVNAGLPMPRVYIIPSEQPNAFATGRNPSHAAIAVTDGIVRLLTPDELKAVLAHELSHVKNRDILTSSIAATVAGAIGFMAQLALWFGAFSGSRDDRDREGGNPVAALLAAIVAPIAATLIQLAISRSREYDADAGGARLCGQPLSLASALAKIERAAEVSPMNVNPATAHMYIQNPLGGDALKGIAALFRTHPPTSERIARLRAMA